MLSPSKCLRAAMVPLILLLAPAIVRAVQPGETCATAGVLTESGAYPFNIAGASFQNLCPISSSGPDVWYSFTAPATGFLDVELDAAFFAWLAIYQGPPCPTTCDPIVQSSDYSLDPSFSLDTVPGATYYFQIWRAGQGTMNDAVFNFSFEPYGCTLATPITANGGYPFDNTDAPRRQLCGAGDPDDTGPVVWFSFTAPGDGTVRADLCDTTFLQWLGVVSGETCPATCSPLVYWGNACTFGPAEFEVVAGLTYYFQVRGSSSTHNNIGSGVLNFEFIPAVPVVAGGTCAQAGNIVTPWSYSFDSTGASVDDPCRPISPAVWYRYTAPEWGTIVADTCGSSYDTFLTAYFGASCPASCTNVLAANNDAGGACGTGSRVTFDAEPGQTYYFAISGFLPGQAGSGVFNLAFIPDIPGERCGSAIELVDNGVYPFDTTGMRLNEPCLLGTPAPTLWYRFDAPSRGLVEASTCPDGEAGFDNTLIAHITNGSCPTSCATDVASQWRCGNLEGEYGVAFIVEPGDTVFLTVSGMEADNEGEGLLSFAFTPLDDADSCSDAPVVVENGLYSFSNLGASLDDPCRGISHTTWLSYTAPGNGELLVETCGLANFDTYLSAFRGDCPLFCENLVASNDDAGGDCGLLSRIVFEVEAGETYKIALSGFSTHQGSGEVLVEFTPAPIPGNHCDEAIEVTENGTYPFSNVDASTDDPCRTSSPTVWYSFTAPANGELLVETCGLANFDTFISAFRGDCPLSCDDRVAFNDDAGGACGFRSRIVFEVEAGATYKIALSGFSTHQGSGEVLIEFTTAPPLLGDINRDGIVNVADVTLLARLVADGEGDEVLATGDINGDGEVDELDVQLLAEMIVNN